jgi:drug/metabolite transporter (DMT)-like permease
MTKNNLLTVAAFLLFVLGIYMIYLGTRANILPPTVTGAGFIIIAAVFWKLK